MEETDCCPMLKKPIHYVIWINTKTDEKEPFATDTIDKFYAKASSDWKLVLESNEDGDSLTEDVKGYRYSFMTDPSIGYVKSAYDWQIK